MSIMQPRKWIFLSAGLALLLTLAVFPASAQVTIDVGCDSAELIAAITTANGTPATDTINLEAGCVYSFTAGNVTNSDNALPRITTAMIINGNGATLERVGGSPNFRLLTVFVGGNLRLSDITVTGGNTNGFGGGINVYDANLVLVNATVSGNTTSNWGGGIYAQDGGALRVVNSVISGNTAAIDGGGIAATRDITVINTLITGNTATANGGGLRISGTTTTIINSTIAGNSAATSGGIHHTGGAVNLTNSIVWGNSETQIGGSPTVTYSTVEGGFTGTGNLSSDPLFVTPIAYSSAPTTAGDYHLQTTSPALDVGSNAALPVDSYDIDADSNTAETLPIDLDGDARVFNAVVDMGAYELGSLLNRLNNPSFETAGTLATKALNWNVTNPKATDKRLCDKPAKPLTTADGLCVYQFSGGNVNSLARTLKQIINAPSWAVSGGSLTISAMVEGKQVQDRREDGAASDLYRQHEDQRDGDYPQRDVCLHRDFRERVADQAGEQDSSLVQDCEGQWARPVG